MADVLTTFASIGNDAPSVWIAREMFKLAERQLKVGKYATRHVLPQRMSKTLRVVRASRMALPQAPLTEGVPPAAIGLTTQNVDITLNQWGIVALITDVALITTVHPALVLAIDRTALAIAETLEREMCKTMLGGTQVIFANGKTSRANLIATDVVNTGTVLTGTVQLRALGAPRFDGDLFAGIMPPQVVGDILKSDSTFQTAHNFVNVKAQEFGEIGIWSGVRWQEGNFLPIFVGVAAPSAAAATATKAQLLGAAGGAYNVNATLSGGVIVVARDVNSDYERKVSQTNTTFALGAGNTALQVATPTSANYTYDIYAPPNADGSGTPVLAAARVPASTTVTISALPTSTVVNPAAPASGVEVFCTWVMGRDFLGRVELSGMSLQSYLTPPGADYANPLAQGRKCGTKIMWNAFILDQTFGVRIESGSSFPSQLPA